MSISDQSTNFTLSTLNLWCFNDWETRLPIITDYLQKNLPNLVFTQETQRNIAIDKRSQIEIINEKLGYTHCIFVPVDLKLSKKDKIYEFPVEHGLGILSKWPITTEIIKLARTEGDKEKRAIVLCEVTIEGVKHYLVNLHFSNSDDGAEKHFQEVLHILKERSILPILAGDFNIYEIEKKYKKLYEDQYVSSSEKYEYVSYPNDKSSLDYILMSKKYEFEDFVCEPQYMSDHKMLSAKIKYKSIK